MYIRTYSGVAADSGPQVLLLCGPSVQFGPQSVGPPIVEAPFDWPVQRPLGSAAVQLQMFTQLAEGRQRRPAGRC